VNKEECYTERMQLLLIQRLKQVVQKLVNVGIETINGR
jgi:hypothetical protein